jgi:hypothetical protein
VSHLGELRLHADRIGVEGLRRTLRQGAGENLILASFQSIQRADGDFGGVRRGSGRATPMVVSVCTGKEASTCTPRG